MAGKADLPLDALESIRSSQAHLTHSLSAFLGSIQQDPLPATDKLLTSLSLLLSHVNSITTILTSPRFEQDLKSTAVYPLDNFPVRQHETILTSLLRRKLLPEDEEWEKEGREIGRSIGHFDPEAEDEFLDWCQTRFLEITEGREYTSSTKTKEERENEDEDEEMEDGDDEENDKGEESKKVIGLGAALKYLAQGWEPTKPPQTTPGRQLR